MTKRTIPIKGKIITTVFNTIYKNDYVELQNNDVVFPDGRSGKHLRLIENSSSNPGCVVLCQNEKKECLLINLYRYGVSCSSLEFPRGYKEESESFIDAASREIREEVNIKEESIVKKKILGTFYVNSAHTASEVGAVLIEVHSRNINIKLEIRESITGYYWLKTDSIRSKIREGKIKDSFTISSLMFLLMGTASR